MRKATRTLICVLAALALAPAAHAADPHTGFEIRNGSSWTTLSEELTFIKALEGPRVVRLVVGTSAQGRAIRLIIVGPSKTTEQIAAENTALIVCGQHGDEPAGREACLTRIRGHARTTPLSAETLLIMPTANPDGRAANKRNNGQSPSRDINRDYGCPVPAGTCVPFQTPEARAVRDVIAAYDPEVVLDLHEYSTLDARAMLFNRRSEYRQGTPAVQALSDQVNLAAEQRVLQSTTASGTPFTTGIYEQEANSYDRGLRDYAMATGRAFVLFESPRLGRLSSLSRVKAHRVGLDGALSAPRALP